MALLSSGSSLQLARLFSDSDAARSYLEEHRWLGRPFCPHCGSYDRITKRKGSRLGYYLCRCCSKEFTVRVGTILWRSHVPLHKWLHAMYFIATRRKRISSLWLAKEIGVTQKTAWSMLNRLRKACGNDTKNLALPPTNEMLTLAKKQKAVVLREQQQGDD